MRLTSLLAAVMLLCVQLPAYAQQADSWIITDVKKDYVEGQRLTASDFARSQLIALATCMLEAHRDRVESALAMSPIESAVAVAKMIDNACLRGGTLKMSAFVLRGALWVAKFRASPLALPSTRTDLTAGLRGRDAQSSIPVLRAVADCLWRADQPDARAVLLREPGTHMEDAAYAGLQLHLKPCSPNQPIRFSKATLSGLLAEVAFIEQSSVKSAPSGKSS